MVLPHQPHPLEAEPLSRHAALGPFSTVLLWPGLVSAQQTGAPARLQSWPIGMPSATGIHDLAPAPDGGVWFSAQSSGHLGWFDPRTGKSDLIDLGPGSSPHGVIAGPDGAA